MSVHPPDLEAGAEITLPERLRLPERFAVFEVGPGALRVQSAAENVGLRGLRAAGAIVGLLGRLDGVREVGALLADLDPPAAAEARQVLSMLLERGVLEPDPVVAAPGPRAEQRLLFSHFGGAGRPSPIDGQAMSSPEERLAGALVTVLGLGQIGSTVARALALAGVGRLRLGDATAVTEDDVWSGGWYEARDVGAPRPEALGSRLTATAPGVRVEALAWSGAEPVDALAAMLAGSNIVVLCPDALRPTTYDSVNRACLGAALPWINHRRLGFEVSIGPLVLPGETPCYKCFELRALSGLIDPAERVHLQTALDRAPLRAGRLPIPTGADALALEVILFVSGVNAPTTLGRVLRTSVVSLQSQVHPLLKIPRCPHCGVDRRRRRPAIDAWGPSDAS